MKKFSVIIAAALIFISCQKEVSTTNIPDIAGAAKIMPAVSSNEMQTLIKDWTIWAWGQPNPPFQDPDGSWQYVAQPYSSGVFMLAGGSSPDLVKREVTISLSQYQYIFVPLVELTLGYNPCDPSFLPKGGQTAEAFFQSFWKEAFNGPRELSLIWDDTTLLSTKQKEARANSGVFRTLLDEQYNSFTIIPCPDPVYTVYSDGYWAKIALTLGDHTLTVGGDANFRKFKYEFSNIVEYKIHVIP